MIYNSKVNDLFVTIDPSKEDNITEFGKGKLNDGYLALGETTAQEMFARVATALGDNNEHAQRLYNYMSELWFMPATPILSNAGRDTGLGISCFLNYVEDSVDGIVEQQAESMRLTTMGGGVGGFHGHVRSRGELARGTNPTTGMMAWMTPLDSLPVAAAQGTTRRGAYAAYCDVSHPEIESFLDMRNPTGGDQNLKCLNIHHAINITDKFVQSVLDGGDFDLVDPHSRKIKKTIKARDLWLKIIQTRMKTGEPYLHFVDTANRALPQPLKDKGLKIHGSNLCIEIELPTSPERTAVCCLSSVNLEKYDEWKKDELFIEDIIRLLDNNLQHFIDTAPKSLWRAVNSARLERSVGLGTFGWHGYLMKKGIPFESASAKGKNIEIFEHLGYQTSKASVKLGEERGEAPDMKGSGHRFAHCMAIAPNASNSTICGEATPSIEPIAGNVFKQMTKAGTYIVVNKYLDKLLKKKYGKGEDELQDIYLDIAQNEGSVQHLDWMDIVDREVFKTSIELDQMWLLEHASTRQQYICQGQSLNLFIEPDADINVVSRLHLKAWQMGIKGLYYCRSRAINRPKNVMGNPRGDVIAPPSVTFTFNNTGDDECLSCSG
jgi:ribonucleoside-diphosphate reductase alpha chain